MEVPAAASVVDSADPPYLFRYRPGTLEELERLQRLLVAGEIYSCSPREFNDPFDCVVDIDHESATDEEWRHDLDRILSPRLAPAQREQAISQIIREQRHRDPERLAGIVGSLQEEVDNTGIVCFSEVANDLLMWSHYALGHKGFCVRFRHSSHLQVIGEAQPVSYAQLHTRVDPIRDDDEAQVRRVLLTKAACWSYEKEWRLVDVEQGPGIRRLPAGIVNGVILGIRMAASHRAEIARLCAEVPWPVELLEAAKVPHQYRLEIRACSPNLAHHP